MALLGRKLKGKTPTAGLSLYVQLMLIFGLVIGLIGTGVNGIDNMLIGFGAFACGVFMAPVLPVWRDMTETEQLRMDALEAVEHPWTTWVSIAKRFGWQTAVLVFLVVCGALAVFATDGKL